MLYLSALYQVLSNNSVTFFLESILFPFIFQLTLGSPLRNSEMDDIGCWKSAVSCNSFCSLNWSMRRVSRVIHNLLVNFSHTVSPGKKKKKTEGKLANDSPIVLFFLSRSLQHPQGKNNIYNKSLANKCLCLVFHHQKD